MSKIDDLFKEWLTAPALGALIDTNFWNVRKAYTTGLVERIPRAEILGSGRGVFYRLLPGSSPEDVRLVCRKYRKALRAGEAKPWEPPAEVPCVVLKELEERAAFLAATTPPAIEEEPPTPPEPEEMGWLGTTDFCRTHGIPNTGLLREAVAAGVLERATRNELGKRGKGHFYRMLPRVTPSDIVLRAWRKPDFLMPSAASQPEPAPPASPEPKEEPIVAEEEVGEEQPGLDLGVGPEVGSPEPPPEVEERRARPKIDFVAPCLLPDDWARSEPEPPVKQPTAEEKAIAASLKEICEQRQIECEQAAMLLIAKHACAHFGIDPAPPAKQMLNRLHVMLGSTITEGLVETVLIKHEEENDLPFPLGAPVHLSGKKAKPTAHPLPPEHTTPEPEVLPETDEEPSWEPQTPEPSPVEEWKPEASQKAPESFVDSSDLVDEHPSAFGVVSSLKVHVPSSLEEWLNVAPSYCALMEHDQAALVNFKTSMRRMVESALVEQLGDAAMMSDPEEYEMHSVEMRGLLAFGRDLVAEGMAGQIGKRVKEAYKSIYKVEEPDLKFTKKSRPVHKDGPYAYRASFWPTIDRIIAEYLKDHESRQATLIDLDEKRQV